MPIYLVMLRMNDGEQYEDSISETVIVGYTTNKKDSNNFLDSFDITDSVLDLMEDSVGYFGDRKFVIDKDYYARLHETKPNSKVFVNSRSAVIECYIVEVNSLN